MKIMSELIYKFIKDLNIPSNIRNNLFKERNNKQLEEFAKNIPNLQYPDTYILAGRLLIYVNIKLCPKNIEDYVEILKNLLRPKIKEFILKNKSILNEVLDETYYQNFSKQNILSASAHTLYLLRLSKEDPPVETPCMCDMRQAIEFYHDEGIEKVLQCYYQLQDQLYVHASPTRFNAGLIKNQGSSCFLITLGDNIEDILYTGVGDSGMISKHQGGIGLHLNNIRHSQIGNSGNSGGIMPFTETFDKNTKCVNQGSKRNGAATLFLNIWHIDVVEFIQARDNYTHNGVRFKSANTALFISHLFMERVKNKEKWTIFCPAKAKISNKKLSGTYGPEFEELYLQLEEEAPKKHEEFINFCKEISDIESLLNSGQELSKDSIKKYHQMVQKRVNLRKNLIEYKTLDAYDLYRMICDMHVKSSHPFMAYRDSVNMKNNMINIGTVEGSNLCVAPETLIFTDKGADEISCYENKEVNIWNGYDFSKVTVRKTGENQELIKIIFNENRELECTKYHKFYIKEDGKDVEYRANQLKPGMKLINFYDPATKEIRNNNFVEKIVDEGRKDDTYCFNELKHNKGWFNGIVCGNCMEINEPSDENNIASCNLGHIPLKTYVINPPKDIKLTRENIKDYFDFKLLKVAMSALVENINKVIDHNYYPLDERSKDNLTVLKQGKISKANLANRPLGIGVSGLGEVFAILKIAYDSDLAKYLNKMIFSAMYYYGLESSRQLALKSKEYESFRTGECKIFLKNKWKKFSGSPLSNGFFQFDLWNSEANYLKTIKRLDLNIYNLEDNIAIEPTEWGDNCNWGNLRMNIIRDGVLNSMILAPMPTASTSQLVRSAEAFEAHQTLIYSRKLVHGSFTVFSEPFVEDMQRLKLWNKEFIEFVSMENGSIRYIDHFIKDNPQYFKDVKYEDIKTEISEMKNIHRGMYEISQKDVMQMSRQRGIYVDQSQSLNIYIAEPTIEKMMGVHLYGSALRLKTGMYYLRQNPASQTDRFTVDIPIKDYHQNLLKKLNSKYYKFKIVEGEEVCLSCS